MNNIDSIYNKLTIDIPIVSSDIRKNIKLVLIYKFYEAFINNMLKPINERKNKKELCKIAGISEVTLRKYMKQLGIQSFYRHDNPSNDTNKKIKLTHFQDNKLQLNNDHNSILRNKAIADVFGT
jgi:hypothetical protein